MHYTIQYIFADFHIIMTLCASWAYSTSINVLIYSGAALKFLNDNLVQALLAPENHFKELNEGACFEMHMD